MALSKQAIVSIHDTVLAFLNDQPELSHFHINESLFKPFENLLCLELCDIEIQDQVQKFCFHILLIYVELLIINLFVHYRLSVACVNLLKLIVQISDRVGDLCLEL